jgi:predicted transcriptional regulator
MNSDQPMRLACCDEFAELCALSTTGALTADEQLRLNRHLADCGMCRDLLAEFRGLAVDGAAKIASISDVDWEQVNHSWDETAAKDRLLSRLRAAHTERRTYGKSIDAKHAKTGSARAFRGLLLPVTCAAVVVLFGVLAGYHFGVKKTEHVFTSQRATPTGEESIRSQMAQLQSERDVLNAQLASDAGTISDLSDRTRREERELAEITGAKDSLERQVQHLAGENRQQSEVVSSLSAQRDVLQHRLDDAEASLQATHDDLSRRQEDHEKTLVKAAGLEARIEELSSQLRESSRAVQQQKEFLASDRDIRELMGARQLYIADVFDVDHNGKKRAPFGRVFYTKGKLLIFYAFDLDQAPGYRNANAFQVWGSQSEDKSKPVSLGVFYKDSEANRRWIFKTEDPDTLAQINAVFVTVETNGPATTPKGKPILYAYLHTAPPNHP